jgi:long-chain acyl-CoA synthetase
MHMPRAGSLKRALRSVLDPIRHIGPAVLGQQVGKRPHPWEGSYPPGLAWDAPIEVKSLTALFDEAVARYADQVSVKFHGRRFRYREIGELVDRAARGFRAHGVRKGVKVALLLPNCPYSVICFFAVLKAGGTVVNVNPLYAPREIAHLIEDSGARFLVTLNMKQLYEKAAAVLEQGGALDKIVVCSLASVIPLSQRAFFKILRRREISAIPDDEHHISYDRLIEDGHAFNAVKVEPHEDVAVLQYTGGTTGTPKGARLTHANLYANAMQLCLWRPDMSGQQERSLAVLPLFHAFGMTAVMILGIAVGAELILLPHFRLTEVLRTIDKEKPTTFLGVPTMFSTINNARDLQKYDVTSLVHCISGGAALPGAVQRRFEELTGCALVEGYGLSEASPVVTVNPIGATNRPGSVGLPLPDTKVEIVRIDKPTKRLPVGRQGEICVSGPQVMLGYENRAKENLEAFRGGRLHTGDVGYLDEDGYLFIVDRIKELILSGGFNVYPRMVEEAVYLHPAVEEAAVCGADDAHRGEIVKCFVKLRDGEEMTAGQLRAFLRDKLAQFEIPRKVEFRDSLPKTPIGKIDKKALVATSEKVAAEKAKRTREAATATSAQPISDRGET